MALNQENKCNTNLDFDKFTAIQLKDNTYCVSSNKEELLKRVKGAQLLKKKPLSEMKLADQINDAQRRCERLVTPF